MVEPLTLDQLRHHEAYLALTEKQQKLVIAYLTNGGNKLAAVKAAYGCSDKSARTMTYTIFSRPSIFACLAVARGEDPEKVKFEMVLQKAARNPKATQGQLTALRLLAAVKGYLPSVAEPVKDEPKADEPQKFCIGDVVEQEGLQYRIEAVPVITQKKKGFLED